MADKSWHMDRRTFLKGTGVALGLPFLDCMRSPAQASTSSSLAMPKRKCAIQFPYGASVPSEDHKDREWGWYQELEGDN